MPTRSRRDLIKAPFEVPKLLKSFEPSAVGLSLTGALSLRPVQAAAMVEVPVVLNASQTNFRLTGTIKVPLGTPIEEALHRFVRAEKRQFMSGRRKTWRQRSGQRTVGDQIMQIGPWRNWNVRDRAANYQPEHYWMLFRYPSLRRSGDDYAPIKPEEALEDPASLMIGPRASVDRERVRLLLTPEGDDVVVPQLIGLFMFPDARPRLGE